MKHMRLLSVILAILLLVGCTGPAVSPVETGGLVTDPDTADPGKTAGEGDNTSPETPTEDTGTVTAPGDDTQPETDPETEPETEPPFVPTTYEEHLAEIYRKTYGGRVEFGGFLTPVYPASTETAFRNAQAAGITFMVTCNEFYGTVLLANTLRVADEVGMDLAIWTFGPHVIDSATTVSKLKQCMDHPSVKYLYLQDEPVLESMPGLKEMRNRIVKTYGDRVSWKIGANMYPYHALTNWNYTVETFLKDVQPDYVCFDLYPWANGGGNLAAYLTNLAMEKVLCDQYGAELWAFLQTAAFGEYDLPTEAQLRCQVNATLAMGADAMICFTATESGAEYNSSIFHEDGTPSAMYEAVQAVFPDIHAMKGVFLPYDCQGVLFKGEAGIANMIRSQTEGVVLDGEAWGPLTAIQGQRVMVGCMTDKEGHPALYVVNMDYESSQSQEVTLTLDGAHTYQLWNSKGLEVMGEESTLTLTLAPGDGCFLALDLSCDATTYPEPTLPETQPAPPVLEAEEGALLFDLGFDADGQVYNKAEDGVILRSVSGGQAGEEDGLPVLSKYDIYTGDIQGAAENGVTVELYLKMDSRANRIWLTLFSDLWGNNNLYRICDSVSQKTGVHYYHGSYDDNDVTLSGDIETLLPTDTWLHIVAVASEAGQYVYVNGTLISEGHFAYTPPAYSGFVISDTRGVVSLHAARIYACAVTEEQVADMYSAFANAPGQ